MFEKRENPDLDFQFGPLNSATESGDLAVGQSKMINLKAFQLKPLRRHSRKMIINILNTLAKYKKNF